MDCINIEIGWAPKAISLLKFNHLNGLLEKFFKNYYKQENLREKSK